MKRPSDYENEMFRATIADRAIEQLLTGVPTDNGELNALVPFVDMLRAQGMHTPSDTAIDRFAAEAAAIVRAGRSTRIAESESPSRTSRRLPWLRPQIAAVLATILIITGMTGVAAAANDAAPSDTLYGLDRALEGIGIGDGGAEERLEEASALVAAGQAQWALEHAAEAFDEAAGADEDVTGLEVAMAAIADAGERIADIEEGEAAAIVQGDVAALLQFISENLGKNVGADGREFGQGVAELARNISKSDKADEPADDTTTPPEDVGEKPDDPGPPAVVPGAPGGNGNSNPTGNSNPNGNGNSNSGGNSGNGNGNDPDKGGNGPPDGSPSEPAPGRGNRP